MDKAFAEKVAPVLLYVLDLLERVQKRTKIDPANESARLKRLVGQLEVLNGTQAEIELAKHAVVYWIDEVLVNEDTEHSEYWQNHTLERTLYETRQRAWGFFDQAKSAAALPRTNVLELFYLCVALGFEGGFRNAPASTLPATADDDWGVPESGTMSDSGTADWERVIESMDRGGRRTTEDTALAPAGSAQSLPGTLEEWAAATFVQVAASELERFVPQAPTQIQRDAQPLRGYELLKQSALLTIGVSLFSLGMVAWHLLRTSG